MLILAVAIGDHAVIQIKDELVNLFVVDNSRHGMPILRLSFNDDDPTIRFPLMTDESVTIFFMGVQMRVFVHRVRSKEVLLGFDAPEEIKIDRSSVYLRKKQG